MSFLLISSVNKFMKNIIYSYMG